MSDSTLLQNIKEARRDALVSNYIANFVPEKLVGKITDADSLYEYLLLDTKISDLVIASPIEEAISSVQLFINRCVEGYEGSLSSESNDLFTEGNFLYNWNDYNKRYSTWSSKERVKYYAGSYIDPTLRNGKTEIFQNMENRINHGKLTPDTVDSALQDYLTSYERLTNLEYISVNKGNDESVLFFIGRTRTTPYEYYWRQLTLKEDSDNKLVPSEWSEWKKISASINDPLYGYVRVYWHNNRLHIRWVTSEREQADGDKTQNVEYANDWVMNSSGIWCSYSKNTFPFFEIANPMPGIIDININPLFIAINNSVLNCNAPNLYSLELSIEGSKAKLRFIESFSSVTELRITPGDITVEAGKDTDIDYTGSEFFSTWSIGGVVDSDQYTGFSVNYYLNSDIYINDHSSNNYGYIFESAYLPPSESNISISYLYPDKNIDLSKLKEIGLASLFDYAIQGDDQLGGLEAFSGVHGIYLWEIFFHIPFLIAVRFQTEERYELAEQWYKYIFNSTGYRDKDGNLLMDQNNNIRYWNVVPLQEDTEWDDTLSMSTVDPDKIALANPIQYKLAIFIHYLDFLISRGDSAYRMLERDTMVEAKMYYIQALQLLGPRPEIRINDSWPDPTLQDEADLISENPTRSPENASPMIKFFALLRSTNGNFLPPYNDDLLLHWDKLELRLFNLRHNLSLDGRPLNLTQYVGEESQEKSDVKYNTGDGLDSNSEFDKDLQSIYHFPIVAEKARSVINSVIQFGSTLESAFEKQDTEAMTLLLQNQQLTVLQQTQSIQKKNMNALQANLEASSKAKEGAEAKKTHYSGLVNNWMSNNETSSLALRTAAMSVNESSILPLVIAGASDMAPNIFGVAAGGSQWGAVSFAVAQGLQTTSSVLDQSANILDVSENYQRRREEWTLLRDEADNEIQQLESQISSLENQIAMASKQFELTETEYAQAQAIYELQSTRFTSQALYNWIAGRLSSLYYQIYDEALYLCLLAKGALKKELGDNKAVEIFTSPVWSDLYQGLLAGEMLMAELQKLDNLWMEESNRGMEAVKTVSLDTLIRKEKPELSFVDLIQQVLAGNTPDTVNGISLKLQNDIFVATLDLSGLGLETSYNQLEKSRKIKNLSVTLPTLLGPYQDIEATLTLGGETIALSHGMNDSGLFVTDFNDSRFLPFEGVDPTSGNLVLSIFNVEEGEEQRDMLEKLNDIIFHIRYVIRS